MRTHPVYKTLIRLAFMVTTVSFVSTGHAADTAKSPAPDGVFSQAENLFKKGDYDKTSDLLWKNIDKLDRKGLILLAVTHEKKKDPASMLKVANMLTSKDPKDYEGFYLLGTAQLMRNKNSEALDALKSALEINPKYQPAYEKLIQMYEKKNNYYELRILYQDMITNLGDRAEFETKLCEINTKDGQEDQALKACNEAIHKDPKIADNYVNIGIVQKQVGDTEEAEKSLKAAADTHSKSEFAQFSYASLIDEKKDSLQANKYYLVGTQADPNSSRCWIGFARTAFDLRKYEVALEAYIKACKLDQKNAVAFRKATTTLRNTREADWIKKYEAASESCSGY